MKRILMVLLVGFWVTGARAATTNTNVVAFALLKATPEKYRGKKVVYEERFNNFMTTMPEYMVRSGINADTHFLLFVGDSQLPVIIRKNAKVTETVTALKPGAMVRVAGRLREFDADPRRGMMPRYYVDADEITPDKSAPPAQVNPGNGFNQGERRPNPFPGPRGRGRGQERP